ncbi:hypothetical protein acsn021_33490 [Anaerocolumna cellulosilytica]|uniref:Uncharacterized protein n=1 Tax=Anaerocolumna cellulosilytica TaxID=433286 RepID=A0A6S6R8L5_9FIRM|nr:hypothetical protein acsn021_33490 [Anaerocolumna cellulosilytica]
MTQGKLTELYDRMNGGLYEKKITYLISEIFNKKHECGRLI